MVSKTYQETSKGIKMYQNHHLSITQTDLYKRRRKHKRAVVAVVAAVVAAVAVRMNGGGRAREW